MKRSFISSLVLMAALLFFFNFSWAQCPEDENDFGECDTLHVVLWSDTLCSEFPCTVHVTLSITHDLGSDDDSISAFTIPLTYTHTNPSAYCSVSSYQNTTDYTGEGLARSVFRNFEGMENRMLSLQWNTIVFRPDMNDINSGRLMDDTLFLSGIAFQFTGEELWGAGVRTLLATYTFRISDTMTVKIDSCFFEPSNRVKFTSGAARGYIPRHNLPIEFKVDKASEVIQLECTGGNIPENFYLSQNYPNPFNPSTNIKFSLSKSSQVRLEIFNVLGQRVKTLVEDQMFEAGIYTVDWVGKDDGENTVSSGIYFYKIQVNELSQVKKMIFLK